MATIINPEIKTILQNEPAFQGLEYEALRQLGLEHIGNLSGRIWTDHNVHDPGITTLEMLCYALLDLGYRTKLPIGQILAPNPSIEDNLPQFFSPAQILSSEPSTILDYRRLLLDIPGVKNAWLEVVRDETVKLSMTNDNGVSTDCSTTLNGLYRIILQLETADVKAQDSILTQVRQTLLAHRNLGEDFLNLDCPTILEECPIPLTSQIEIEDTADPATVFSHIVEQLNQYFCPQLHYYTLGELLAKGKQIEDIYAGRPYTTDSFGFVDPDELLAIRQQKEIHFSDIYSLILEVEGVKRIRNLQTPKTLTEVSPEDSMPCVNNEIKWLLHLPEDKFPVFDLAQSAITLFRKKETYTGRSLQESKVFRQSLNDRQKVRYQSAYPNLDLEALKETYREDLADYYSIQHEFPKVYGIGLDGLGPSASAERRAKALQFKGYLLFFERLLADFLAQLGSIRSYFALIPESERPQAYQQTYFAQSLESVPQIEKLNRLSANAQAYAWTLGKGIARLVHKKDLLGIASAAPLDHEPEIPAFTFEHLESRTIAIQNIKTAFQANQDIKIIIAVNEFGEGFRFGIYFDAYDFAWLSEQNFETESDAYNAATLMGTQLEWPDSLRLLSEPCHVAAAEGENKNLYGIQWIYSPPEELSYLQLLMESPRQYQGRRHQFLDHLLGRFAEQFTDYSLQMYAMFGTNSQTDAELLEVKSQYLSRFDRLSHNRAHAFDYGQQAWDTQNISGLEANLAARLGINWSSRQSLCPFIPIQYETEYELKLRVDHTSEWLEASRKYTDTDVALADLKQAIQTLRKGNALRAGDGFEHSNKQVVLPFANSSLVSHHLFQDDVDQQLSILSWDQQFREEANPENTEITRYAYQLQLKALKDEEWAVIYEDEHSTDTADKTWQHEATFIKDYQSLINQKPDQSIKLIPYPGNEENHLYLDIKKLESTLSIDAPQYRWQIVVGKQVILTSVAGFDDKISAEQAILTLLSSAAEKLSIVEKGGFLSLYFEGENCATSPIGDAGKSTALVDWLKKFQSGQQYVKRVEEAYRWQLIDPEQDKELLLEAPNAFANKIRLEKSWSLFKTAGNLSGNYSCTDLGDGIWEVSLKNTIGEVIARSPQEGIKAADKKSLIARLKALFQRKTNSRIISLDEAYSFQISDAEANVSLQSFNLYLTPLKAWETLLKLPAMGKVAKNFVNSGDVANLNYSFYLRDSKGVLQAIHPHVYEEEKVRNTQIKAAKTLLKNFQIPYQTQAEYRFLYSLSEEILLVGESWYQSQQKARAEGKKTLSLLAHPDFVDQELKAQNGEIEISLMQADEQIACAQTDLDLAVVQASLDTWKKGLEASALKIDIDSEADQWQFNYFWPTPNQIWTKLLSSVVGYETEQAAIDAYKDFVQRLPDLTVIAEQSSLNLIVFDGESLWLKSEDFAADDKRMKALNWLNNNRQDAAIIRSLEQVELNSDGTLPDDLSANIFQTQLSSEGVFGYQVIKKESPLAVLQIANGSVDCSEDDCVQYWPGTLNADLFPNIIRDSDAYRLLNGLFHFEIAWETDDLKQLYFVSEKGYASAAEAIAALNDNYIQILSLACDPSNYAPSLEDRNGRIVFGEPIEADCPQDYAEGIMAFVPSDTLDDLAWTVELAVSFLTAAAERFPLKLQENTCIEGQIVPAETDTFYYRLSLVDGQGVTYTWQSYQNYQTPTAVLDAWCEFLLWKDYREGYHCFEDWTEQLTCQWEARSKGEEQAFPARDTETKSVAKYCAIYEVLLESSVRHTTEAQVWDEGPAQDSASAPELGVASLGKYGGLKSNYLIYWDYTLNSYQLSVGTESHQLVEHPESFQLPEDRDQRLQWLVQNPAYTKLSEESGSFGNESVIISEETPGNYRFYIYVLEEGIRRLAWRSQKLYRTLDHDSEEAAQEHAREDYNRFCDACLSADKTNWGDHAIVKATQDKDCGPYRIVGLLAQHELAHYPMTLDTFEAANQLAAEAYACLNAEGFHLLEHILFRPRSSEQLDDCLAGLHGFEAVKSCSVNHIPELGPGECEAASNQGVEEGNEDTSDENTYIPLLDPISFWATLVLPKWSYRYQFENFKELLLDELNAYAPAHIAFKICWLPPQQMCEFEGEYRQWLKALKQTKICKAVPGQADPSLLAFDDCTTAFLDKKYCDEKAQNESREPNEQEEIIESEEMQIESTTPANDPDELKVKVQTRSLGPAPQKARPKPKPAPKAQKEPKAKQAPKPKAKVEPKAKVKAKPKAKAKPKVEAKPEVAPLTKREKTRLIRQRLATHQAFLKEISNKNILKSGSYKRLEVLFSSLGTPAEVKAYVDFLFQYPLKKKESKSYADYLPLLYQAISFGLDQSMIASSAQSVAAWPEIIEQLKTQKVNLKALHKAWNPQEMKALVEAKRYKELDSLLKK